MAASALFSRNVIEHLIQASTWTAPAGLYMALFTADPGATGDSDELSGNGYARTLADAWIENPASSGNFVNEFAITFPPASAAWGTVTHWGIFDAATAGNFLFGGELSSPETIDTVDQQASYSPGAFSLSIGSCS